MRMSRNPERPSGVRGFGVCNLRMATAPAVVVAWVQGTVRKSTA